MSDFLKNSAQRGKTGDEVNMIKTAQTDGDADAAERETDVGRDRIYIFGKVKEKLKYIFKILYIVCRL